MANIIALQQVNKTYKNGALETPVLFDINLNFAAGSLNSIIGQSGSGKTTLMNIMGILDQPTSGDVLINDQNIQTLNKNDLAKLRNQTIGFIFQFHYLLPEYTVLENTLMPALIRDRKLTSAATMRAKELLDLVGLANWMDKPSTQISGGQQQRTAIARALMNNPAIILADEPTGNLDSKSSDSIHALFCTINREFKTTFVIITHDDRIAAKTERIVEIRDGRILNNADNTLVFKNI